MELNLELGNDVVTQTEGDSLESNRKFTLDTGIYDFKIKQMYPVQNKSGSFSMQLVLETSEGKTFNPLIYFMDKEGNVTTEAKSGTNKGKKIPIRGYSQLDTICKASIGKPLPEVYKSKQSKVVIKQFTKDEKITVDMLMDVIGKTITLGIEERRVNKQGLVNGTYQNTAEERIVNELNKVYFPGRLTAKEVETKVSTPVFATAWLEKYEGQLIDQYKPVAGSPLPSSSSSSNSDPFA